MEEHSFTARIEAAGGGGAYVTIPFDVEAAFGMKRVPVRATIDGAPYRGTLVRMGGPDHMLIVRRDVREKIGRQPGDEVRVTITLDTEERTVEVPADLRSALDGAPAARALFDALSYTHRREYVQWIEEAKKAETRERRIAKALEQLAAGRREP
jgi:hypothetical protein